MNTVQIKEEIFAYVHNTTRVLLFLIQKCSVDKYLSGVSVEIVQLCCNILNNKEIAFDTKKNCGLIVVYTFNFLPSEITRDFVSETKYLLCSTSKKKNTLLGLQK